MILKPTVFKNIWSTGKINRDIDQMEQERMLTGKPTCEHLFFETGSKTIQWGRRVFASCFSGCSHVMWSYLFISVCFSSTICS